MKLSPGTRPGPYEIVAALGAGGMGEVYRAKDTRLGREVALKLLPDATHRDRFVQEARVVAALNHPNIVAVFDVGDGQAMALSADGNWVLAALHSTPPQLIAIPVGPGETVHLPQIGLNCQAGGQWFADSRRILFAASEPGKGTRLWTQNVFPQDTPQPFTGERMTLRGHALSPDGTMVVATAADRTTSIYPINGDPPIPVAGLQPDDEFVRWSPDGKFLYVSIAKCCPSQVFQLDRHTGARKHWMDIAPTDRTGVFRMNSVLLTPDAATAVYGTVRYLVNLQLIDRIR